MSAARQAECPKTEWQHGGLLTARSSGSTGAPKTLVFQRQQVINAIEASAEHFGWAMGPDFIAWCPLSLEGVGGRMFVWRALHLGWTLLPAVPSLRPDFPAEALAVRANLVAATPHQTQHLSASGALKRIDQLLIGGAPMPPALEQALLQGQQDAGPDGVGLATRIHHTFGMTETLTHIAERNLGNPAYRSLPGVSLSSREGQLVIDAPNRGVHELLTRDEVEIDPTHAGRFFWHGRTDNVINSDGLKIHPEQIEDRLIEARNSILAPDRFYIIGRPHAETGEQVTLVIDCPDQERDEGRAKEALAVCRKILDGPTAPRAVECREFEWSASGKLLRR